MSPIYDVESVILTGEVIEQQREGFSTNEVFAFSGLACTKSNELRYTGAAWPNPEMSL
jgi:hypothetical protein